MIVTYFPLLLGPQMAFSPCLSSVIFPVYHISRINGIFQYMTDLRAAPEIPAALRPSFPFRIPGPKGGRSTDSLLIEPSCDLYRGHPILCELENPPHHPGLALLYNKAVSVLRILLISKGNIGAYELPHFLLRIQSSLHLQGKILAVQVRKEVLEGDFSLSRSGTWLL